MMNDSFNWQRFLRTLRWDLLSNKKTMIRYTVGMTFGLSLFYLCMLVNIPRQMHMGYDADGFYFDMATVTFGLACVFMALAPTGMFEQMKTKLQRVAFLMLPASNVEKWVVRFLTVTLGAACMVAVAIVTADLIRFVFALFLTPGHYDSVIRHIWMEGFGTDGSSVTINSTLMSVMAGNVFLASWALLNHSFYTLGGALFRRHALLLTIASQFVIGFGLLLAGAKAAFRYFENAANEGMNVNVDVVTDTEALTFVYVVSGVFVALSLLFYWLSYKVFTRMQVINNKWLNV